MNRHIKSILTIVAMGVTVVTVLLMWMTCIFGHISPAGFGWYGVVTLLFPIFAVANAVMLVFWCIFSRRYAIVPILGFLCCISDVRAYCPVNFSQKPPKDCIKVMTYNVANFDGTAEQSPEKRSIIDNIMSSKADIVCLQEGDYWATDWKDVEKRLRTRYKYMVVDGIDETPTTMRCFSRFPIIRDERLTFEGSTNASEAYYIRLPKGDTILVLSCHLQSYCLTPAEVTNYADIVSGRRSMEQRESKLEFLSLLRKLRSNNSKRAVQADSVHEFIRTHSQYPTIVCGDFNDTPVSYTHRVMSRSLKDAYISTGNGPGFSYFSHSMHVRIDNMLCSRHWTPYRARVENHMTGSDHYPMTAFFRLRNK